MKFVLITLIATPVIFLLIAFTLALLPVSRMEVLDSLDFDTLDVSKLPNIEHTENQYTARDGSSLFYREVHGSSDTVIVLLHGSGTEGRYLLSLANNLNQTLNATVVIPDLRGHGNSSLASMGDISYLGQFNDDLEDLQTALIEEQPNANYFLGGHSSGGGLALRFAASGASLFSGSILLAPYLGYNAPTIRENSGGWVQVATRRYAGLVMLNKVGIKLLNSKPVLFFNRPKEVNDNLQTDSYSFRLNESFSPTPYEETLANNKKPSLVIVGEKDEAFYADQFEAVFQAHAINAQTHVLPGLKHLNLHDDEKTAELVSVWILESQL